jgi:hypothetical protein
MPSHSTHINYYTRPACMGLGTLKITNFPIINRTAGLTGQTQLCFKQLRMSRFDLQNPPFRAGYRYEYRILWGTSGTEITTTHPCSLL